MSKELEPAALEGVVVDGPIPLPQWIMSIDVAPNSPSSHFVIDGDHVYMTSSALTGRNQ